MKVELATHFNDIIVFHGLILQSQPHSWDMVSVLLLCGLPLQLLTRHPASELQAAAPPQPRRGLPGALLGSSPSWDTCLAVLTFPVSGVTSPHTGHLPFPHPVLHARPASQGPASPRRAVWSCCCLSLTSVLYRFFLERVMPFSLAKS